MDQKTKALFDFYSRDKKHDFYNAYLYMTYLHQFEALVMKRMGLPVNPSLEKLAPELEAMLEANLNIVQQAHDAPENDIYHGKVISSASARSLLTVNRDLRLEVPETVLPFRLARDILLQAPVSVAVGTCPCRLAQAECTCMPAPMEACLFIGNPHADFIADHNPRFRKIDIEEAVAVLEDCHDRGFVHCAYFKQDMGGRLFAICNCCSCCCGGIKMHNAIMSHTAAQTRSAYSHLAASGLVASINEDCTGCGACTEICPFDAIGMSEEQQQAVPDLRKCMGCGVCEDVCPTRAITLRREPTKGGILDLDTL